MVDKALTIGELDIALDIRSTAEQILNVIISTEDQQRRWDQDCKDEEERREARETRDKILDSLAHPEPSQIHNTVSQSRKSDKMGRWSLDGATFRAFKETPRLPL